MPLAANQENDAGLAAVVAERRKQISFRVGIGAMVVVCYGSALGLVSTCAWFALYVAAQVVEGLLAQAFVGRLYGWRRGSTLVSMALSAVVFGGLVPVLYHGLANFGLGCGAFLLAGAILTTIQSTTCSPAAFFAIACPFFLYALASPLLASSASTTWHAFWGYQIAAIMLVLYSLTTWKQARQAQIAGATAASALRASESKALADKGFLDLLIESMPAMLVIKDVDTGRYRMINRTGEAMLGRNRVDMIGRTDHELFSAEEADTFVAGDQALLADGSPILLDGERVATPRGDRELRVHKALLRNPDGSRLIMAMAEDVTEANAGARALEAAAHAAQAANFAKSAFLATMSHEIRTPLNGVLGMAQAMSADVLSTVQRERLEVIRQSGDLLLAVLNDVLDISKIEAGKLELELLDFDLAELMKGARSAFTDLANSKGLSFSLVVDPEAQGFYRGDPTRLRQILYNLISNGVKFTATGEVRVQVSCIAGVLGFEVSDTGIGLSPDQLEQLFTKFAQGDVSTTRRFGGTGLGLAICRELAEMMDGDIEVRTEEGAGSVFTLRLILPRVSDVAAGAATMGGGEVDPASAPDAFPPLRLLAAEDNPVNQLVLKALLHQASIEPVVVENGRLAVEAWERQEWDVVLMDMHMPEMDGISAVRAIREAEVRAGRPRTPIIALTANAMSHHVAEYADAGLDCHVAKPIDAAALFAALEAVLGVSEDAAIEDRAAA